MGSILASRTIQDTRKPLCFLAITPTAPVGVFVSGRFLVAGGSALFLPVPKVVGGRPEPLRFYAVGGKCDAVMSQSQNHPSFSFYIESGKPQGNVVPASVLVQILQNTQQAFELIGVHVEGRGLNQRAHQNKSWRKRD